MPRRKETREPAWAVLGADALPAQCWWDGCKTPDEPIDRFARHGTGAGHCHHINGDHSDNRRENLAIVHHRCHAAIHHTMGRDTTKAVEAMRAANVGRKFKRIVCPTCGRETTAPAIARFHSPCDGASKTKTKAKRERTISPETRAKISAAMAGRKLTDTHKNRIAEGLRRHHRTDS